MARAPVDYVHGDLYGFAPNRLRISGESAPLPTGSKMILAATRLALAFGALQGE